MEVKRKLVFDEARFASMKRMIAAGYSICGTAAQHNINECTLRKHLKLSEVNC